MKHLQLKKSVISAMLLALCLVLPFLTLQNPELGNMLSLIHLPVLLCGLICGPLWGFGVGLTAAPLRSLIFSAPPVPKCFFMAPEMAAYGLVCGILYRIFPKKLPFYYLNLLISMVAGRFVYGIVTYIVTVAEGGTFLFQSFLTATVLTSLPGILLQLVLIPLLLMALTKAGQLPLSKK